MKIMHASILLLCLGLSACADRNPGIAVGVGTYGAGVALFSGGSWMGFGPGGGVMVVGPFLGLPGGVLAAILMGIGLMGLGIFMVAAMAILTKWLIDATIWYARLHYRVVKPALEPAKA